MPSGIKNITFIGAGTMGTANAVTAALAGYQSLLFDASPESLQNIPDRFAQITAYLISNDLCSADMAHKAIASIKVTDSLSEATRAPDLVSESVTENLAVKRAVHAELDRLTPEHTLLTTNTSNLLVSAIETAVCASRAEHFAALHSHLGSPLIDIVPGPRTSKTTIDSLEQYVISLGATPLILKKEHPGYVVNAMLGPLLTNALLMVGEGKATPIEIDRAWMVGNNVNIGPFGLIDAFGLNLIRDSWLYREHDESSLRKKPIILSVLNPLTASNRLGHTSGAGFYDYPDPIFSRPEFITAGYSSHLSTLLNTGTFIHAVLIYKAGVASVETIDKAWTLTINSDSGPFAHRRLSPSGPNRQEDKAQALTDIDSIEGIGWYPGHTLETIRSFIADLPERW